MAMKVTNILNPKIHRELDSSQDRIKIELITDDDHDPWSGSIEIVDRGTYVEVRALSGRLVVMPHSGNVVALEVMEF